MVRRHSAEEKRLEDSFIERSLAIYQRLTRSLKRLIAAASSFQEAQDLLRAKGIQEDFEKGLRGLLFRGLQASYRMGQDHAAAWVKMAKFAEVPKPEEAIAFMRVQSFAIARVEDEELKKAIQDALVKALEEGEIYDEWKKRVDDLFDARGVTRLSPYHARIVFRNNMMHSYNAGRYAIFHDRDVIEAFPYFRYEAIDDDRTSEICRALNGKIYHRDNPIWKKIWPPNHHLCRSDTSPVSAEEVQSEGLRVGGRPPSVDPDDGFKHDPTTYSKSFGNWLQDHGYVWKQLVQEMAQRGLLSGEDRERIGKIR